ncbi:MAG: hypothetical protein ABSG76_23465 [Xanthobacteraceae bacterium]|jgi:hypothetical protein
MASKRRHGCSRDKRSKGVQMVIALIAKLIVANYYGARGSH